MAKPFNDIIKGWPSRRLARVDARAKELIAEEMTLRDLRKARSLTQVELAKVLDIGQEHVSRIEQKSDMLLSTLAGYVRAMGGNLRLIAEFPDRTPVFLLNLADVFEAVPDQPKARKGTRKSDGRKAA